MLKKLIKKNKLLYNMLRGIKGKLTDFYYDVKSIKKFKIQNKISYSHKKKKVVFLTQYVPAWNKTEPIYRKMLADKRFEPIIVCIPDIASWDEVKDITLLNNDTYKHFVNNGYDVLNAIQSNGSWLDLKLLEPDYVFYPRPYNNKIPSCYYSNVVSRYSKICFLMYSLNLMADLYRISLNTDFHKDVYCYFAETEMAAKKAKKKFIISNLLGLRKVRFYGMPALESIVKNNKGNSESWSFTESNCKVIWTPRWTTDKKLGGTNFFQYYESILDYACRNEEMAFLLRPHPLMFDNFIKTGEMSRQDVNNYCARVESIGNVSLDTQKEYVDTLYDTDIMISDVSGITPEFFVTGKPVIFCDTNIGVKLAPHTIKMMEGCYVAKNEEQLFKYLDDLKQGIDPLKDKRINIIKEVFGQSLQNSTELIVNELA